MHGVCQTQCVPILALDIWEHAYFFKHPGQVEAYVDEFWKCINWEKVSANFEKYTLANKVAPLL